MSPLEEARENLKRSAQSLLLDIEAPYNLKRQITEIDNETKQVRVEYEQKLHALMVKRGQLSYRLDHGAEQYAELQERIDQINRQIGIDPAIQKLVKLKAEIAAMEQLIQESQSNGQS